MGGDTVSDPSLVCEHRNRGDADNTDGKTVRPWSKLSRGNGEQRPEARASGDMPGQEGARGWEMVLQVLRMVMGGSKSASWKCSGDAGLMD